jgi:hypothetical protein
MNHTNDYSDVRYKSSILSSLASSTIFVACTHGALDGICSSYTNDGQSSEFISWADIGGAVVRAVSIPGHNLALLYSCQTVYDGSSEGQIAFDLNQNDMAYGGFDAPVFQKVKDMATGEITAPLSNHADRLLQELQEGECFADALSETQSAWRPVIFEDGVTVSSMIIVGDGFLTLNAVYVAESEISTYGFGKGKWYLVL